MPNPTRNQRFQRSNSTRKVTSWAAGNSTAFVNIPAASKVLVSTITQSNPGIAETVLRTIGSFMVATDNAGTGEEQIGALGAMVVTDVAAGIGVASLPGPITNIGDDGWFLYVPIVQRNNNISDVGYDSLAGIKYDFNSKARRRMEDGYSIVLVVENAHATFAFDFAIVFRLLSQIS